MVSAVLARPLWWTVLRTLRRLTGLAAASVLLTGGLNAGPAAGHPPHVRPVALSLAAGPVCAGVGLAAPSPTGVPVLAPAARHPRSDTTTPTPADAVPLHDGRRGGSAVTRLARPGAGPTDHRCAGVLGQRAPPGA